MSCIYNHWLKNDWKENTNPICLPYITKLHKAKRLDRV